MKVYTLPLRNKINHNKIVADEEGISCTNFSNKNLITANWVQAVSDAISMTNNSNSNIILFNTLESGQGNGIFMSTTNETHISGNHIDQAGENGILLECLAINGCDPNTPNNDNSIFLNFIKDANTLNVGANAIRLDTDEDMNVPMTDNLIKNNQIKHNEVMSPALQDCTGPQDNTWKNNVVNGVSNSGDPGCV